MKNKKNIILVYTQDKLEDVYEPHLGLVSIGTILKKNGYDAVIVRILADDIKKISQFINKDSIAIGLSVKTIQVPVSLKLSRYIKEKYPLIAIIWGGVHPNLHPRQVLENENIDIVVFGDGEYTLLEIVNRLKNKKSLREVRGCGYKYKGKLIINKPREFTDFSKLPKYDYSILPDIESYIKQSKGTRYCYSGPYLPILSSVGCPFNCSFCYNTAQKLRRSKRTIKNMLDEIEELQKKHNINYFSFKDELFFSDKERIKEFLKEKKRRNLDFKWDGCFHISLLKGDYYSDEFIKEAMLEGLTSTGIGIEAGSIEQLRRYKKGITPQDVIQVAKRLNKLGLFGNYSFMIGAPYETYNEMVQTMKLIYQIKSIDPYSHVLSPQIFRPYPGCDLYKEAIKLGFKEKQNLGDWAQINPATGYTSYKDLAYLKPLLPKIYNLFYYFKLIKFLFKNKKFVRLSRINVVYKLFTDKYFVNFSGFILRRIIENRLSEAISRKIFKRSLILIK